MSVEDFVSASQAWVTLRVTPLRLGRVAETCACRSPTAATCAVPTRRPEGPPAAHRGNYRRRGRAPVRAGVPVGPESAKSALLVIKLPRGPRGDQ